MNKNALVIYKGKPAIVNELQLDKIEIVLEDGKKKVRNKDVELLTSKPVASLQSVLQAQCPSADFEEAAIFFEGETPSFSDIIELVWSELPAEQYWSAWQVVCSSPFFKAQSPDKPVLIRSKEEVEAIIKKQNEKLNEEKEKQYFILTLTAALKGNEQASFNLSGYSQFMQEIEAFALGQTEKSKFLKAAGIKETPEEAHNVLLKTGYWGIDKNPYPQRFHHPLNSPKFFIEKPEWNFDFTDLTHLTAFAIDNNAGNDPDDAVCFDGKNLWIHIADPADSIVSGSQSDIDAQARGATLYVPDGISRMLGESAVEYFALGLEPVSHALSFCLTLNEKAEILSVDIKRTKIKVKCISYEEASLQKDSPELKPLFDIAEANLQKRTNAGAVSIQMPEVNISLSKENGKEKTVEITQAISTAASKMIKEMMLLAGEAAAYFTFKNNIPFQYISQEISALPKQLPQGYAGEFRKRKAMRSRNVSISPAMHCGLGLAMYSQVTSPLRRYGDLAAHHQLLRFIDGKPLISADDLFIKIAAGDMAARNCAAAERISKQHWTLVYLLQNPQWTGEAVILETIKNTAVICIPALGFETSIDLHKSLSVNEKITVKAGSINLAALTVKFAIV